MSVYRDSPPHRAPSGSVVRDKLEGIVEVDESWIGGRAGWMHKAAEEKRGITHGSSALTATLFLMPEPTPFEKFRALAKVVIAGPKPPPHKPTPRKSKGPKKAVA